MGVEVGFVVREEQLPVEISEVDVDEAVVGLGVVVVVGMAVVETLVTVG